MEVHGRVTDKTQQAVVRRYSTCPVLQQRKTLRNVNFISFINCVNLFSFFLSKDAFLKDSGYEFLFLFFLIQFFTSLLPFQFIILTAPVVLIGP